MNTTKMKTLLGVVGLAYVSSLKAALPDPIAWFDMKDVSGNVVTDASGNGRNLTLGSTVSVVSDDLVGQALKVTGQKTDWASFSCPVVTNATIAFWMKRDASDGAAVGNYPYIVNKGFSGYIIDYSKDKIPVSFVDQWDTAEGSQLSFSNVNVEREVWHHFVVTVERTLGQNDATFEVNYYIDGVSQKTASAIADSVDPRIPSETSVVLLNIKDDDAGDRATKGEFADFRFYDRCLSVSEVEELAATVLGKRLVVRYAFDELSPATDADGRKSTPEATGLGNAITLGKNMELVDDGVDGKALRFMSTTEIGGQVKMPQVALKERTMSVWLRQSSLRKELDKIVDNQYPRLFHGFGSDGGYVQLSDSATLNRDVTFVPSGFGTTNKAKTSYGVSDFDVWSHLAIVERLKGNGMAVADIYVNGVRVVEGSQEYDLKLVPMMQTFFLGCNSVYNSNRYYCGDMDEFRIYNYALSADEIRRLASGLAKISAGEDFTVAGKHGVLQGEVSASAADGLRTGYAGTLSWTLVSAPEGGEGASILQPSAAESEISLPVAGTYVFRLTIFDLGASSSDDVVVTCVAEASGNVAPTVSAVASSAAVTQPDPAVLTATVSDDGLPTPAKTRVRWAKKSGPGGVWFDKIGAERTTARFGTAGTYVLTCVADDGQAVAAADVTIVVADRADGKNLSSDLLHYWSLNGQVNPYFIDPIGKKTTFTAPDYKNLCHEPGKVNYGARAFAYSGAGAYWSSGAPVGEEAQTQDGKGGSYAGSNPPPVNDYLTISAWVYVDPDDEKLSAGNIVGASVVGQNQTLGLRYNEKGTQGGDVNTDGFTLYQQGRKGTDATESGVSYAMLHYPAPVPSPKGRWLHLCGVWARNQGDMSTSELWYDGVKQTKSSSSGNTKVRGRTNTSHLLIGGMDRTKTTAGDDYNENWAKPGVTESSMDPNDFYSRTFPGVVDEVRIWKRKLTPAEIRYLAANPVIDENRGPSVDTPTATIGRVRTKEPTQVMAVAFADKLPSGGALTYAWSVVSDNALFATFGDAASASTTFSARKKGTYILQLAVSDGERTVCSKPLSVEVTSPGLFIVLQ